MTPVATLWAPRWHPLGKRVLAVAAYGQLELEVPEYNHFQDNYKPEFKAKFPLSKIPAIEFSSGFKLVETSAICRYLPTFAPKAGLLGQNAEETALVDQWVSIIEKEINIYTQHIFRFAKGITKPYDPNLHKTSLETQWRGLNLVEAHLATHEFFVGNQVTIADITLASCLIWAFGCHLDADARARMPNTVKHFEKITQHPLMKPVFGEVEMVETALPMPEQV